MNCNRCMGLCIADYVEENGRYLVVRRCINCGSVIDPTILSNKVRPQNTVRRRTKYGVSSNKRAFGGNKVSAPVCA